MLQVFHTEHSKLEVVLSNTGDEGGNAIGVTGPSVHFEHGGDAFVVEFDKATLVNKSFDSNHAPSGHIIYAQFDKQAAKGVTAISNLPRYHSGHVGLSSYDVLHYCFIDLLLSLVPSRESDSSVGVLVIAR